MYSDLPNLQDNPNFDKVLASLLLLPLLTRHIAVNLVVTLLSLADKQSRILSLIG